MSWRAVAAALALVGAAAPQPVLGQAQAEQKGSRRTYRVLYDARIVPSERAAHVRVAITGEPGRVRRIDFRIDPKRHTRFEGDGRVESRGDRVVWEPPEAGGELLSLIHI